MKYTKTLLAAAVAVSMVAPMAATTAHAASTKSGTTESTSGDVTLKYQVESGYSWTIHSDIDFGKSTDVTNTESSIKKENNEVKVTKNVIAEGNKLVITVNGNGATDKPFSIQREGGSHTLDYTVTKNDSNVENNGEILSVAAGTNEGNVALTYTLKKDDTEVAGAYSGTVTYKASIVNAK